MPFDLSDRRLVKWDIHVYDPRSQTTKTHVIEYPGTSRADGAAVTAYASRDLRKKMDHILAVPHHETSARFEVVPKKAHAQIKREVDEILASKARSPAQFTSEAVVDQMIGRRVKSGWHGLIDGEIIQWEPFGAGVTDVLVKDVASGHLRWYASHGLTPIDGRGPLPSRSEVRRIREAEMATSMKKISERWAKEPSRPRTRR